MGNTLSKKQSVKDRLLSIESQVLKSEYELDELMHSSPISSTIALSVLVIPVVSFFSYTFEVTLLLGILPGLVVVFIWYFLYDFTQNYRKTRKRRNLELLKEERKKLIERCKNDLDFTTTKNLIEKYEDEESRNSFFRQMLKKKKSPMESVSDFVLGNDPSNLNALICSKCGVHNGLLDPKNEDFSIYYCFSCKHKNIRKQKGNEK